MAVLAFTAGSIDSWPGCAETASIESETSRYCLADAVENFVLAITDHDVTVAGGFTRRGGEHLPWKS